MREKLTLNVSNTVEMQILPLHRIAAAQDLTYFFISNCEETLFFRLRDFNLLCRPNKMISWLDPNQKQTNRSSTPINRLPPLCCCCWVFINSFYSRDHEGCFYYTFFLLDLLCFGASNRICWGLQTHCWLHERARLCISIDKWLHHPSFTYFPKSSYPQHRRRQMYQQTQHIKIYDFPQGLY